MQCIVFNRMDTLWNDDCLKIINRTKRFFCNRMNTIRNNKMLFLALI